MCLCIQTALSARLCKTRCYTNVVCCSLKITPWKPMTAKVPSVAGTAKTQV